MKVLIVDDEKDLSALLAEFLEGQGFRCAQAASLAEASAQMESFDPDYILLDQYLPDGNGIAWMARFQGLKKRPWVAMVSGAAGNDVEARALAAGVNRFFCKPVNLFDILKALREAGVP